MKFNSIFFTATLALMSHSTVQAEAACVADCHTACEQNVFRETPNEFSAQKCRDLGGQGRMIGGTYLCSKYRTWNNIVRGDGKLIYQAQMDAKDECLRMLSYIEPCDLMSSANVVGGYSYRPE